MLATFYIFMIDKTDINQFTCFYKNIFFNMYIQQSNLYRTTIMYFASFSAPRDFPTNLYLIEVYKSYSFFL